MNTRQQAWADAANQEASRGNGVTAGLFAMLAQPNTQERRHDYREHAVGFRRDGRRGLKCGIDGTVIKWVDEEGQP